jgi:hypothetical protein
MLAIPDAHVMQEDAELASLSCRSGSGLLTVNGLGTDVMIVGISNYAHACKR